MLGTKLDMVLIVCLYFLLFVGKKSRDFFSQGSMATDGYTVDKIHLAVRRVLNQRMLTYIHKKRSTSMSRLFIPRTTRGVTGGVPTQVCKQFS